MLGKTIAKVEYSDDYNPERFSDPDMSAFPRVVRLTFTDGTVTEFTAVCRYDDPPSLEIEHYDAASAQP